MFRHQRLRTVVVALAGAAVLGLGSTALTPVATAAPQVTQGDSPFAGLGGGAPSKPRTLEEDRAKKAEKFGGGLASEVIDLISGVVKCGLNIATDAVQCSL
ncbi:hypothetical protein [Nocardia sp. NPDC005366]|uniref:hypothetical protein n=1 Tax=Nocardia sp. NPDC005366 TaxID=3156878 RepID=UPI00339E2373